MLLYALLTCLPLALAAAGCSEDGGCPTDLACVNSTCVDPCKDGCGEINTVCKVTNHRPFCFYLPDPKNDTIIGLKDRESQEFKLSLEIVRKVPRDQPVYSNSQTVSELNHDLLKFLALAQAAADNCNKDRECPRDQACIDNKCQDPCKDGCADSNTVCNVINHRPFCYYIPHQDQDVNTGCKAKYTTQCKTTSTSDYDYMQFFPLSLAKDNKGNLGPFNLRFKVQTATDAHVLLSNTPFPSETDPVIEVVIGGWSNSKSVIRARKQGEPIPGGTKQTKNIVSKNETRGFWVKKYHDDLIAVGVEGSSQPIMQATDPHSVNYQYFSFSSWEDGTGSWLYDCTDTYTACKLPE